MSSQRPFDLKSVDRFSGVEPLQEQPGLVRIIAGGEISRDNGNTSRE